MNKQLIFVYNADSGLFNTVTDIAHKMLSPATYSCNLCAITHSYFSVRENWTNYIKDLSIECEFLHRDEFIKKYKLADITLPAIFSLTENNTPIETVSSEQINACKSIGDLKQLISTIA